MACNFLQLGLNDRNTNTSPTKHFKNKGSSSKFHIGSDQGSFVYDKLTQTNLNIPLSSTEQYFWDKIKWLGRNLRCVCGMFWAYKHFFKLKHQNRCQREHSQGEKIGFLSIKTVLQIFAPVSETGIYF